MKLPPAIVLALGLSLAPAAEVQPFFKRIQISEQFWAEGAAIGDFNHDGQPDVCSGPFWYAGPDFKQRHEFRPATASFKTRTADGQETTLPGYEGALGVKNSYSDCFLTFVYDFNQDGWDDILVIGLPGTAASWYENPQGREGHWQCHTIFGVVDNESPVLADVTGDSKPELLCCSGGCLGFAEADWKHPAAPWTFHPVTPKGRYEKYTHGLGYGDVNGDGRVDVLEKDGWWEQPAAGAASSVWLRHPFPFAPAAAQMLVYDVNGDGLNDVLTCINAHGYGLSWFEQTRAQGNISFQEHVILNKDAKPNPSGVLFSQPHALALADVDGDGLLDLVTGKRFWAHGKNGPDPDSNGPALLYWFKLSRLPGGQAEFRPFLVDDNSGVGTQVTVGFLSSKQFPDLVVGNKKGLFVFENQCRGFKAAAKERTTK